MSNAGHAGKRESASSGNIVCFADKIENEIRSQIEKEQSNFTEDKLSLYEIQALQRLVDYQSKILSRYQIKNLPNE